jgi:opacity protein-like surface antigen
MNNTYRAAVALALVFATVSAAALTLNPTADPYYYAVADNDDGVRILGRSVVLGGQKVYVEYISVFGETVGSYRSYHEVRDREFNELAENERFLLADGEGREYKPFNVRFVQFQDKNLEWETKTCSQIIEYSYAGESTGGLQLIIKTGGTTAARVDFGPADKNYFRRATVTADVGLNMRISPYVKYGVAEVLMPDDTFYLTGARYCSQAGKKHEKRVYFYEIIRDGREGWVAREIEGEDGEFFTIGEFAAF